MDNYLLPTLSDLFAVDRSNNNLPTPQVEMARGNPPPVNRERCQDLYAKAEKEWYSAIAAVNQLLQQQIVTKVPEYKSSLEYSNTYSLFSDVKSSQGLVLSGPTPVLNHPSLTDHFATSVFTTETGKSLDWLSVNPRHTLPLLPAADGVKSQPASTSILPLWNKDPLTNEQFCLVLNTEFSLLMVLGKNAKGEPAFLFSFDPEIVWQGWMVLRKRILFPTYCETSDSDKSQNLISQCFHRLTILDNLLEQFTPIAPNYKIVMNFSRLLLENLPLEEQKNEILEVNLTDKNRNKKESISLKSLEVIKSPDVELLQAIAHEVRTPLATIRTLTRLLLKRPNLTPEIIRKRLQMIDTECSAQIDRFNLIFRAVELETQQRSKEKNKHLNLTTIPLAKVFQDRVPIWQKQANQRNHRLDVILPPKMPTVVSDPTMLDQVLGNLIENFSRNLPSGSHIQVGVMLAGSQLKLQLESHSDSGTKSHSPFTSSTKTPFKSLGPLLMFQPETGSLTLNLKVTKNLFEAIGGKLVVRQRPQKGEVMTIFLPVK
ncbi:MAG: HAMP domain-containing sensor histidine kinase [Microcoleaceae cyanobacterium MO_207.B10]|nr:HAMP domain-containing sensor histidine kinase [Microcoleaceae cyanobacterium MO_207.B10]